MPTWKLIHVSKKANAMIHNPRPNLRGTALVKEALCLDWLDIFGVSYRNIDFHSTKPKAFSMTRSKYEEQNFAPLAWNILLIIIGTLASCIGEWVVGKSLPTCD